MPLLAPLLFALMAGLPVAALLWVARRQDRRNAAPRGFEVPPLPNQTTRTANVPPAVPSKSATPEA